MPQYETVYMQCPTGVYRLAGTVPAYMDRLLFATEETAQEALAEARAVLSHGAGEASEKFTQAYLSGQRMVK